MRLSDIKGARVLDVLADIAEPAIAIASDREAMAFFTGIKPAEGQTAEDAFAQRMREGAPALLKGHRDEVLRILAALDGVTPEEYEEGMTLASVLVDLVELLTDKDFAGFLSSQEPTQTDSGLQ